MSKEEDARAVRGEMPRQFPPSMGLTSDIKTAAEDLYWCARERYSADGQLIMRGGTELVSLYARPTAAEAADLVLKMNATIDPLRKRRIDELTLKLRVMLDELQGLDY